MTGYQLELPNTMNETIPILNVTTAIPTEMARTAGATPSAAMASSPSLLDQQQEQQQLRSVRFHAKDSMEDITYIPTVEEYDPTDRILVWGEGTIQEKDTKRKKLLKQELKQFLLGRQSSDNKNFTTVGLRDKFGMRQQDKIHTRDKAYDAVLFEQYLQKKRQLLEQQNMLRTGHVMCTPNNHNSSSNGNENVKTSSNMMMIAKAYRNVSRRAHHVAHEEAKELEKELRYLQMEKDDPEDGNDDTDGDVDATTDWKKTRRHERRHHHQQQQESGDTSDGIKGPRGSPRGRTPRKETCTRRPTFDVQAWLAGRVRNHSMTSGTSTTTTSSSTTTTSHSQPSALQPTAASLTSE